MTLAARGAARPGARARFDRRTGGRWTRAQTLKNALIRGGVRTLLAVADRVPVRLLRAFGAALGRVAGLVLRSASATARARTLAALPKEHARAVARASFTRAGENLALCALLRRPSTRAGDYVSVSEASRAVLTGALTRGRGAIVVSAHLGPFELVPAVVAELGIRPAIVVRESYDPDLDPVVDAHRRGRGVDVIHRGKTSAAVAILRALRRGQPVGLLPDLGGRGVPAAPIRFLGESVAFPLGPAELARRAGCPLLIGVLARREDRSGAPFELVLEEIRTTEGVAEVTQRVAAGLEEAIKKSAEDWLWMVPPNLTIAEDSKRSLFLGSMRHSELGRV